MEIATSSPNHFTLVDHLDHRWLAITCQRSITHMVRIMSVGMDVDCFSECVNTYLCMVEAFLKAY
jgi:hypothetical protein